MVYHNLSMSLNHHVPIFNCTVTIWGGVSLSNCKLRVLSATSLASSAAHTLTHTQTHTDMAAFGYVHVQSQPLPLMWHHLFWVMWPCFISTVGTLVLNCISSVHLCTLQMLYIKGVTQPGGRQRWNSLFSVTIFRPFLIWKKHIRLFVFVFFPSLSILQKTRSYFLKFPVI